MNFTTRTTGYKDVYRYVGHAVAASEKSDLDHVSSLKRPNSRWGPPFCMIFSLTCLALLVSPDSAGGGLVRAHVNSRRRVLFSFFYLNIPSEYWYVYIFTYLGMSIQGIGWGGRYDFGFRCSNLGWLLKTKTLCPFRFFCSIFNICTMIEVSSEQSSSQLYMHSAAAAAAAALLVCLLYTSPSPRD